jgi:NADH dehydrogenase
MENSKKQIVLIGGGYASIWAYRSIIKELLIELMEGQVQIKLICPEEFHCFHGWTAESLTGIVQDENRMSPLKEQFKFAEIIKGKAGCIDPLSRQVYVDMTEGFRITVPYDHLFLGMGSVDNTEIDGLKEHGFQLKSYRDYRRTKMQIQYLIRQAAASDTMTAEKNLQFVIAGAGFTGVEIAANLGELLSVMKKKYTALRNIKSSIKLINSKTSILPGLNSGSMRRYTEKILGRYGIEIINQAKINQVTGHGVKLSDGRFLDSRMVVSTIGQSRININGTRQMDRDSENRIILNSFLQVSQYPNIWGAGDTVHVKHPGTHKTCPSNALWAIRQGEHAGKNISRAILAQSLKSFTFKGLGQCASLGIGKGIGELYGIPFNGWFAWIMRWFFFQHFMPSRKVMWQEIADWFHLLIHRERKDFYIPEAKMYKPVKLEGMQAVNLNQPAYQN